MKIYRLGVLFSHPIQYHAPLLKKLAAHSDIDLMVFFCSDWGVKEYRDKEFGKMVKWDTSLLSGYTSKFLSNLSPSPDVAQFLGLINPSVIAEILRGKYDGLIIHGYNTLSYHFAYLGAYLSRTPVFFRGDTNLHSRNPAALRIIKRKVLSVLFRNTTAFLTLGTASRLFYKSFGIPESKMFFAPLAVDNEFFIKESDKYSEDKIFIRRSLGIREDLPVIVFVGKLIKRKKPFDLLFAYENIKDKASVIFVGDGALKKDMEQYAQSKSLEKVLFVGFKNQTELPKYYGISDIFALTSKEEITPLVINEAMCSGLPVVVSDAIPSAVDFVKSDRNGFTYPVGDINKLKDILEKLAQNPELRNSMGNISRSMIQKWSAETSIRGILNALRASEVHDG